MKLTGQAKRKFQNCSIPCHATQGQFFKAVTGPNQLLERGPYHNVKIVLLDQSVVDTFDVIGPNSGIPMHNRDQLYVQDAAN